MYYSVLMHRSDVHRVLFGQKAPISSFQFKAYSAPRYRAVSSIGESQEKAHTALVLALTQALDISARTYHSVAVFVPEDRSDWFLQIARDTMQDFKARLQGEEGNKRLRRQVFQLLREWVANLNVTSPQIWPSKPPEYWAAYGYMPTDATAKWLKSGLI